MKYFTCVNTHFKTNKIKKKNAFFCNCLFCSSLSTKRVVPNVALRRKEFELKANESNEWRRLSSGLLMFFYRFLFCFCFSNSILHRFLIELSEVETHKHFKIIKKKFILF